MTTEMFTNRAILFILQVTILISANFVAAGRSLPRMEHGKWSPVSFPAADFDKSAKSQEETSSSWTLFADRTEYRVIQKVLDDCMKSEDGITCLKTKAISFLDRAARLDSIPLFTGVSLARQQEEVSEMPAISEAELETTLPRGWSHKNEKLDQMIYDRLSNFLANHTLVMDVSEQAVQEGMIGFV